MIAVPFGSLGCVAYEPWSKLKMRAASAVSLGERGRIATWIAVQMPTEGCCYNSLCVSVLISTRAPPGS